MLSIPYIAHADLQEADTTKSLWRKGRFMQPLIFSHPARLTRRSYFNSELFSDLTIKLGEEKVKCHKIVLCQNSEYFRKLLNNGFQVRV